MSAYSFCNGALSPRRLLPGVPFSKNNHPPAQPTPDSSDTPHLSKNVPSHIPPRLFKDELKALMGGDDSTGLSDNEEYYATLSSTRGGSQSATTSPVKQPHIATVQQMQSQVSHHISQNTALQEMLKNKVFISLIL